MTEQELNKIKEKINQIKANNQVIQKQREEAKELERLNDELFQLEHPLLFKIKKYFKELL